MSAMWRAQGIAFRYPRAVREAVDQVSLVVEPSEVVALVGPNGAGKTTLLALLLGTRAPLRGRIVFDGRPVGDWPASGLARRVGVMPQHEEPAFPITVRELVAMGRYPHLGAWRAEGVADRVAIQDALARCGLVALAERFFSTLSGGERQRARLARALAQEPQALALDEPTGSLDMASEMEMWELLRREADAGRAVLLTTHNLNLAARCADRLLLMSRGQIVASGPPSEVLTESLVEQAYGWPVRIVRHPGPGPDVGIPQVVPLREANENTQAMWPSETLAAERSSECEAP